MRLTLACFGLLFPSLALGATPIQEGANFGLGVGGGLGATGLSAKYFIGADFALQGVVGLWNPVQIDLLGSDGQDARNIGEFALSVDALFESQPWINGSAMDVAFNGGLGLAVAPAGGHPAGLSLIGGMEFDLEVIPIDIVLEYRPHMWLVPLPNDWGRPGTYVDFLAFTGHIRVYPFPAGPR